MAWIQVSPAVQRLHLPTDSELAVVFCYDLLVCYPFVVAKHHLLLLRGPPPQSQTHQLCNNETVDSCSRSWFMKKARNERGTDQASLKKNLGLWWRKRQQGFPKGFHKGDERGFRPLQDPVKRHKTEWTPILLLKGHCPNIPIYIYTSIHI